LTNVTCKLLLFLLGWFVFFPPQPARADTIANLAPAADTSLLESNPTNNLGKVVSIPAGTTAQGRSRILLRFDLTQLPANAAIISADLTIVAVNENAQHQSSTFGLNRLLRDWGEGTGTLNSGDPAKPSEATWTSRFHPSLLWSAPGGAASVDYVATASATQFVDALGSYTFSSTPSMVGDVQGWVDNPGTNFGWILISQSEGTAFTVRRFAAREDPVQFPVLTVHYALRPIISQPVVAGNQVQFSFQAESNMSYTVESRSQVNSGTWASLTNFPAQATSGTRRVTDSKTNATRLYRIRSP
jgi:hypothetical protein